MDPQIDLPELVEDLEVNIDELTATLEPLLSKPLHTTASSLPLLDKAKLYTLSAYAIESILFSVLKASGVDVTEHAIFKEIARLKGYNSKIREAEERNKNKENRARLDVAAAGRFIKHGLSGNDEYDLERRERMAKEKARAHLKAQKMVNKKFDDDGKEVQKEDATPKKRGVDEVDGRDEDSDQVLEGLEEAKPAAKKARVDTDSMDVDSEASKKEKKNKKKTKAQKTNAKKEAKKAEKQARQSAESTDASTDDTPEVSTSAAEPTPEAEADANTTQPRKRGRPSRKDKAQRTTEHDAETEATPSKAEARVTRNRNKRLSTQNDQEEESIVPTPDQAPKTRSETFNALLDGSLSEKNKSKRGGKKGSRGKGK